MGMRKRSAGADRFHFLPATWARTESEVPGVPDQVIFTKPHELYFALPVRRP